VITGSVETNVHKNDTATELPQNSIYVPVKELIGRTVSGKEFGPLEIDVKVYAEEVVKNVLKSQRTLQQ
jgi:hypothetical protein